MMITVKDVIVELLKPVEPLEMTVDTLKFGDPNTPITGIVTTFIATQRVLEIAKSIGANLVISHEGVCFSHHDSFQSVLQDDPVWREKCQFINESKTNLFRLHDYCHRYLPDMMTDGLIKALEWQSYVSKQQQTYTVVDLPNKSIKEIAEHVKMKLNLPYVRVVGDISLSCSRIGIMVGYRGGGSHAIPLFEKESLDLILYGEGPEWETPEYVRDAIYQGRPKALMAIGHLESEEPGMKVLAERLEVLFPSVPVHFVKEKPLFQAL